MQHNITYRERYGKIQFILSYKDRSGKWRQKSKQGFEKKSDAKKAADKMLDELKEFFALQINDELDGITFKEFTEMLIENMRLYKEPNTVTSYKQTVKKFNALAGTDISKISPVQVQKCIDEMVRVGLKPTTVKAHVVKLKTLFKNAITPYRIITSNPVFDLRLPEEKQASKDKALNISDLEKLLNSTKSTKKYMVSLLAAKCGLRLGEIVGLTWSDIDYNKKQISINKQWKQRKDGTWGFGSLKSKSSYRIVPAPKSVLQALINYKKISPTSIDKRIFPFAVLNGIGTDLAKHYRKLGYNLSVHDLRHTFASLLIAGGTDFRTAAQILGHAPEETIRTYSHVTSDMMEKAAKTISNIFD